MTGVKIALVEAIIGRVRIADIAVGIVISIAHTAFVITYAPFDGDVAHDSAAVVAYQFGRVVAKDAAIIAQLVPAARTRCGLIRGRIACPRNTVYRGVSAILVIAKIKADYAEFLTGWISSRRPFKHAGLVQGDLGVVAKDDVGQVVHDARIDRVITVAPEDDVGRQPGADHIVAAECGVNRHDVAQERVAAGLRVHKVDVAVVAQDNIVAIGATEITGKVRDNRIILGPAKDDVIAQTRGDHIIAADGRALRGHAQKRDWKIAKVGHGAVKDRSAVVAKNDVITLTRVDQVIATAAKDQIGARARGDLVVVAQSISDRHQGAQCQTKAWDIDFDRTRFKQTTITQNNVRSFGGVDFVAIKATQHDIIAATCVDHIAAAIGCVDRCDQIKRRQVAVKVPVRRTKVTEDQIDRVRLGRRFADICRDHVMRTTAEDQVSAVARPYNVVATGCGRRGRNFDQCNSEVTKVGCLRLEDHIAVIAQNDVISLRRVYVVAGLTTQNDIGVIARTDFVGPATGVFDGPDCPQCQTKGRHIRCRRTRKDLAAVPDNQVLALACVNIVVCVAPDDNIAGAACTDDVIAADEGICRHHTIQCRQIIVVIPVGGTEVPEDQVHRIALRRRLAHICHNVVVAEPAKDQISTKAGTDGIIATRGRIQGCRIYQRVAEGTEIRSLGREQDLTIIAEHDIVALTRIDHVTRLTADNDVRAGEGVDRINATHISERRGKRGRRTRHPIGHIGQTAGAKTQAQGAVFIQILEHATVAKDDIIRGARINLVGILTTKDHKRQARIRCGDNVSVAHGSILVIGALGVQRKEVVGVVQRDHHVVIAQARVQRSHRLRTSNWPRMCRIDKDRVVAKAGPVGHAA